MKAVTQSMIVDSLRKQGIQKGDLLVVHAALSSFGNVDGGAAAVAKGLREVVGPNGTLMLPSLPAGKPYDFRKTPTGMGAIAEYFRKLKGVHRSICPCVPAAAKGPLAEELIKDHEKARSPYINGPWDKAAKADAWTLLLGVDHDRNTVLHCAEAYAKLAYMNPADAEYIDAKGKLQHYKGILYAGPHRNFIAIDPLLKDSGIQQTFKIGKCVARLMRSGEILDFCIDVLLEDPAFFLTKNEGYYGGIMQRGKVNAARIKKEEDFILGARTSTAGPNTEEVLWHAQRSGATVLEVDTIDGRDVSALNRQELMAFKARVKSRNLKVGVVRPNILSNTAYAASLKAAKTLGAKIVIAPLTGSLDGLLARAKAAREVGLELQFENVALSSDGVREMMVALGKDAALAFNPANFAAGGELAFLGCFHKLKKWVRTVAITDASPEGVCCLPGGGNGEVKEIMSILRCASFDGHFILGAAPSVGLEFDAIADAFYGLLDRS
jgi:aminoglycoside 3-N-acetyltransferase